MILWRGDFSGGDLSQWTGAESVDRADRLRVVPAPLRPTTKALQVTVRKGDLIQNGVRNEVYWKGREPEGAERWYRWSTLFPESFPVSAPWQVWTQWHQAYRPDGTTVGTSPPVAFCIRKDRLCLVVDAWGPPDGMHEMWSAPIPRGWWIDVLFHVRWSADPKVGFVELTVNGTQALPKTFVATNYPGLGLPNYLKQGLYRSRDIQPDATIYHQGMTVSDAAEDLTSAPAQAAPPRPVDQVPAASPLLSFVAEAEDGKRWILSVTPQAALGTGGTSR